MFFVVVGLNIYEGVSFNPQCFRFWCNKSVSEKFFITILIDLSRTERNCAEYELDV